MKPASAYIASILVVGILPVLAAAQSCTPPAGGDWLVNGTVLCSGQFIVLNGSLLVNGSGNLTLQNSSLLFNSSFSGQFGVDLNGSFRMSRSTLNSTSFVPYTFISNPGSNLEITDSSVNLCGFDSSDYQNRGIAVRSAGAKITNNTFYGCYASLVIDSSGANVSGNRMLSNVIALQGNATGLVFAGNYVENGTGLAILANSSLISGNTLNKIFFYGITVTGNNNVITKNEITFHSALLPSFGIGLGYSENNSVSSNSVVNATLGAYVYASKNTVLSDNSISNSAYFDVYLQSARNASLINMTGARVLKAWYMEAAIRDASGTLIPGSAVVIRDRNNNIALSGTTNQYGRINATLNESIGNASGVFAFDPYSINATKSGYYGNIAAFNLTEDKYIEIILAPVPPPQGQFSFAVDYPRNETYMKPDLSTSGMLPLSVTSAKSMESCNYSVGDVFGQMEKPDPSDPTIFQAYLNVSAMSGGYTLIFYCTSSDNITNSSRVSFTVFPSYECAYDTDCGNTQSCVFLKCENLECACGYALNHKCVSYECCQDSDCEDSETCDKDTNTCITVSCECPEKRINHRCSIEPGYCCNDLQCGYNETCDSGRHLCVKKSLSVMIPDKLVFGVNVTVRVLDQDRQPIQNVRIDVKYLDTDPPVTDRYYTNSSGEAGIEIRNAGRVDFVARKDGYFTGNSMGEVPQPFNYILLIEVIILMAASAGIVITVLRLLKGGGKGSISFGKGPLELEKSVSGTTVMLRIRNNTKKRIEGITVRDSIPLGAFINSSVIPRIEPLESRTTLLTWEILQLEPDEEVTIEYETYRANPGFSVRYRGKEYRG